MTGTLGLLLSILHKSFFFKKPQRSKGSLSSAAGLCLWVGYGGGIGNLEDLGPQLGSWWSWHDIQRSTTNVACVFNPPPHTQHVDPPGESWAGCLATVPSLSTACGTGAFCALSPPVVCQLNHGLYPGSVPNQQATQTLRTAFHQ